MNNSKLEEYFRSDFRYRDTGTEVVIHCTNRKSVNLVVENNPNRQKLFGLYEGQIQVKDNFDDKLPDIFWLGDELK